MAENDADDARAAKRGELEAARRSELEAMYLAEQRIKLAKRRLKAINLGLEQLGVTRSTAIESVLEQLGFGGSQLHTISTEARDNLGFKFEPPDPRVPLKLRRVDERTVFPTKALFADMIAEVWPRVCRQLPAEERALVKPTALFARASNERDLDPQALWRAWDNFVLPEQRKSLAFPLPPDWPRQAPNADRFESHRLSPTWAVLGMDPYAASLVGLDPLGLVGRAAEEAGLHTDLLSLDIEQLGQLLAAEDEVWLVARVTGRQSVLVLATMERLGDDGNWRIMWQLLDERERDSAIKLAQRTSHYRDSKGHSRDSDRLNGNYHRDSAQVVDLKHARLRVAAGKRLA